MGKWGTAFDALRDVVYGQCEFLDLFEQTTLHFIYRRTHFYGKEWERIPLRHFLCGIWSKEYGCITPPIRISEKKLLESLKSLEAKTIIQVRRAVTKSNTYRIVQQNEIDFGQLLHWYCNLQPHLVQSKIRQMEHNRAILDDLNLAALEELKNNELARRTAQAANADHPTGSVTTTPHSTVRVPAQGRDHNKPISSKKPMKVIPRRSAPRNASSIDRSKRESSDGLRMLPRPKPTGSTNV
ncbi:hypothetical protein AB7M49_001576 [Bradyrhizobium elkanii]